MPIIDNINNKVYKYKTSSDSYGYDDVNMKATYPINMFNEIGTLETMLLNESIYSGEINEDFTVILDFKDAVFDKEYSDVKLLFEVNDSEGKRVIPTLIDSVKSFNIKNSSSSVSISSEFNNYIDYNKVILPLSLSTSTICPFTNSSTLDGESTIGMSDMIAPVAIIGSAFRQIIALGAVLFFIIWKMT